MTDLKVADDVRRAESRIVAAIDRLTAEVKALREAQETALRLAQGLGMGAPPTPQVFRGEEGSK